MVNTLEQKIKKVRNDITAITKDKQISYKDADEMPRESKGYSKTRRGSRSNEGQMVTLANRFKHFTTKDKTRYFKNPEFSKKRYESLQQTEIWSK